MWDAASRRALKALEGPKGFVFSVSWSPDGKRIASSSYGGPVKVWEAASGRVLLLLDVLSVTSLAWHPDGQRLVVSSESGFNEIWDLGTTPPRPLGRLYTMPSSGFALSSDGYVSGPPEALELVRFGDGWALYDLTDLPERYSPERVAAALRPAPPPESPAASPALHLPKSPRSRNGKGPGRRSA